MTPAVQALASEMPEKAGRITRLANENPRFVKLANTWRALGPVCQIAINTIPDRQAADQSSLYEPIQNIDGPSPRFGPFDRI